MEKVCARSFLLRVFLLITAIIIAITVANNCYHCYCYCDARINIIFIIAIIIIVITLLFHFYRPYLIYL